MFDRKIIIMLAGLMLTSCNDRDLSSIEERAKLEGQQQVQADNENLHRRVNEMEEDLAGRHEFYQATKGVYEGVIQASDEEFRIRITLAPSLPPVETHRIRTLEEVEFDLTNLNFNIQIVQWKSGLPSTAVGCRVQGVRPDIAAKEMTIATRDCSNLYRVRFGNQTLDGFVQPTTNANVYSFQATKTDDAGRKP